MSTYDDPKDRHCSTCPTPEGRPSYCKGCPCRAAGTGRCLALALTDEELDWLTSGRLTDARLAGYVARLIAALRASRSEVGEAWSRGRSYGQAVCESELAASRAEVERLREDARENYARAEQAEQALIRERANR